MSSKKNQGLSELADSILDAIKQGVNITNINGTTNLIIAIAGQGGSVYIKPEKGNYKSVNGGFVKVSQINHAKSIVPNENESSSGSVDNLTTNQSDDMSNAELDASEDNKENIE